MFVTVVRVIAEDPDDGVGRVAPEGYFPAPPFWLVSLPRGFARMLPIPRAFARLSHPGTRVGVFQIDRIAGSKRRRRIASFGFAQVSVPVPVRQKGGRGRRGGGRSGCGDRFEYLGGLMCRPTRAMPQFGPWYRRWSPFRLAWVAVAVVGARRRFFETCAAPGDKTDQSGNEP